MEGLDDLHAALAAKGVEVPSIAEQSYGMRDFYVTDPFGNTVGFGETIKE